MSLSTSELTSASNPATCLGPTLGYNISSFANLSDAGVSPDIVNIIEVGLLVVLVLHPIVAGLALLSAGFSLFLASHAFSIVALIFTIITAIIATVSLAIDLALVLVARSRLPSLGTFSLEIDFGNGVWLILTAVILTWAGVILLSARACYCLGVRRYVSTSSLYCVSI